MPTAFQLHATSGVETIILKRDILGQIPYQPQNPFIVERSTDQPWTPGPLGWNDRASRLLCAYSFVKPKSCAILSGIIKCSFLRNEHDTLEQLGSEALASPEPMRD